ncbi:hypothetical protein Tco_0320394 [Tanacetum coccineum]
MDKDLSAVSSVFTSREGGIKDLTGSGVPACLPVISYTGIKEPSISMKHIGFFHQRGWPRFVDEIEVSFSSTSPRVAKAAFTVSFGGRGTNFSLRFNQMIAEKSSRLKDRGLSKLERVKVIVLVVVSASAAIP